MPKGVRKPRPLERYFRGFDAFVANDRGVGYDFWLFHGYNYLTNNPFPGIYRGDQIYRSKLFAHVMAHFLGPDGKLTPRGREGLMWISATHQTMFRAAQYIRAFARKYSLTRRKSRDPHLPDDPYVKIAVEAVARILVDPIRDWGAEEPPTPQEYYKYRRRLKVDLNKSRFNLLNYDPRTRNGWLFWADVHREAIARYGLPPGVQPFRLEYRERRDRGYLKCVGRLEDRPKPSNPHQTERPRSPVTPAGLLHP